MTPTRTVLYTGRWTGAAAAMVVVLLVAALLRLVALDRLPPGLHFDEAVYGLLAKDIVAGARPVFFSSYTGREPLYMYLMALLFTGVGSSSMVIRLTSAFCGVATVAITYALGRAVYGRLVGVTAAGLLAVSYWHLTVSRNGYPNILIPPLEALSAFFLWRAWRTSGRRWLDWALGGAFAGLVLYTYLAARFYPVFLVVFFVYAAVVARDDLKRNARGVVVAILAAAVVFAPLGLHFLRSPHDFLERANQVLAWERLEGSALVKVYLSNAWETFRGLLGRGDPRWHYNLPGRSVFQPLVGLFFLFGLAVCVRRIRDIRFGFPLLWIAVLVLPGVLTLEMQPAGQRIFGVFPALMMVPAIGLVATAQFVGPRLDALVGRTVGRRWRSNQTTSEMRGTSAGVAGATLIVLVLFTDGVTTVRDYFFDWVRQPETYHIFNADYAAMAPLAAADLAAGNTVVLLTEHYKHAAPVFLAPDTVDRAIWADPAIALPIPTTRRAGRAGAGDTDASGDLVYYRLESYPSSGSPAIRWLDANASNVQSFDSGFDDVQLEARGAPPLDVVRQVVPWDVVPTRTGAEPVDIGGEVAARSGGLDLALYGVPHGAAIQASADGTTYWPRDEGLVIPVEWSVLAPPAVGRSFSLHLRDQNGTTWAQADESGYLADQWRTGDRVLQWFSLPVEPTIPPGVYDAHLMLTDESAQPIAANLPGGAAPSVPIATVVFNESGRRYASEGSEPIATLGDGLAAMEIGGPDGGSLDLVATPGAQVIVDVLWARLSDTSIRDVGFVLVSSDGEVSPLSVAPVADRYPPVTWEDRELLRGRYPVRLPPDLKDGTYDLFVLPGNELLDGGAPSTEKGFRAGTVRVSVGDRLFEAPQMSHPLDDVLFDADVALLGYDVDGDPAVPDGQVVLTLYWQASRTPGSDAKVFAHLLGADRQLVAQHDGVPGEGARPLTGWLPGEVIVDRHVIDVPAADASSSARQSEADEFGFGVGLYDPVSGARWSATESGRPVGDSRVVLWERVP